MEYYAPAQGASSYAGLDASVGDPGAGPSLPHEAWGLKHVAPSPAGPNADPGIDDMWQMTPDGMDGAPGLYPERPGEQDCAFYMRTGLCGFGMSCRFNHPPNRKLAAAVARGKGEYPERPGQQECQYYLKTGNCKFGATCKYHHPRDKAGSTGRVQLNVLGLPLRPSEKECSYYMRTSSCKYSVTCKFHHPQPAMLSPTTIYPGGPSAPAPAHYQGGLPSWPGLARAPYLNPRLQSSYTPVLLPSPQTLVSVPTWSTYQGPLQSPDAQHALGTSYVYGPAPQADQIGVHGTFSPYIQTSAAMGLAALQPQGLGVPKDTNFPERPGQQECQYYMKTGDCKFGITCRFHHPKDRATPSPTCTLSPMGLPLRPGAPRCTVYIKYGICKFGPTCKYDHPLSALSHSPSASSLADVAVAPYPMGSSTRALAPSSSSTDPHVHDSTLFVMSSSKDFVSEASSSQNRETTCRFHHPTDRATPSPTCTLSPMVLPLRPVESEKLGQACCCCEASGAMAEAALPASLLELLDDLESPSPSLSALPPPAGSTSWGDYFLDGEDEELRESRRDVRLRIMTAIGNCRSFKTINLNPERARGMYSLREVEAIALLEGLKRNINPALESLQLPAFKGFGTLESCKALAAAIVRPSSSRLKFLDMQELELSVEGVGHISAALRDNSASLLRVLNLDDNDMIGNAAGARHIAAILTHSPALRELGLWGIGMDDAGAMVIADAVAHSTTLDRLHIGYDRQKHPEQAAMLISLLTALTPDHVSSSAAAPANRSITQLWLEVTGLPGSKDSAVGLAEAVAAMLAKNPTSTLELLRVSSFFVRRGLWALAHNTKITRLEVVHQHSQDEEELDSLLVSILQECKKVEVLQLVFEKYYGPSKFTKAFFQGLGDDLGIKRLVLDGWNGLDDNMYEDLIQSLSSNTNLEEISIKGTTWERKGMCLEEALSPSPRVKKQLRALIAELESDSPVLNELPPVDIWGSYFDCECDKGIRSRNMFLCRKCQSRPEWQWALRLHLLTAVGNCRTLRKIYLNPDRPRISRHAKRGVKLYEARAFLTGLQDNSAMQELDFGGYGGFVETQDCLRALTVVISRSYRSLDFLGLQYVGLTAEGLGAIAAALRRNCSSTLSGLDLSATRGNEIWNAVGAQHLADILSNTPTLEGVAISDEGMDEEGAVLIAKSLAHTTTLTRLMIQTQPHCLDGPKYCLGPLLQALVWPDDFDSETPDNLGTATMASSCSGTCSPGSHHAQDPPPAFNVSITTLVLEGNYKLGFWEEEELRRVLEKVLRSNRALDELSVSSFFITRGLGALRDNRGITKLQISHTEDADDGDMAPGLITILEKCKTIQELQLQFGKRFGPCGFTKWFFQGLQNNSSIKTLVLDGWDGLDEGMFRDLMRSLGPDSNSVLEKISIVETSWESQGKGEQIQDALTRNARRRRSRRIADRQGSSEVPPSLMSPNATNTATVSVPGRDNKDTKDMDLDELRPDIVARGFSNHFNEDFDGQRVLCLLHKDAPAGEFHFFFFHHQGMALLLGVGLRYARVVVEANLCNIQVHLEEDERMWRSRWNRSKMDLFAPIYFERREGDHSEQKASEAAVEQFGVGILNSDMRVMKSMGLYSNIPHLHIYGKGTCPLLVLTKKFLQQYNQLPSSSLQVQASDCASGSSRSISSEGSGMSSEGNGQSFETATGGSGSYCTTPGTTKEVLLPSLQKEQPVLLTDSKATAAMKGKVFEITIILDFEKFKLKATKPDTDISFEASEEDLKLSLESLGLQLNDVKDLKESYIQCEMKLIFWEEAGIRHIETRLDVDYQLRSMVGVQFRSECPYDHFGWFHDGMLIQLECKDGFGHCRRGEQSIYSDQRDSEGKVFASTTVSDGSSQGGNLKFGVTAGPSQLAQVDVHYDDARGKTTGKALTYGGETSTYDLYLENTRFMLTDVRMGKALVGYEAHMNPFVSKNVVWTDEGWNNIKVLRKIMSTMHIKVGGKWTVYNKESQSYPLCVMRSLHRHSRLRPAVSTSRYRRLFPKVTFPTFHSIELKQTVDQEFSINHGFTLDQVPAEAEWRMSTPEKAENPSPQPTIVDRKAP